MAHYSAHYRSSGGDCFYQILRVPNTATLAEIKASYRKLALRLHPDLHKNDVHKTREFMLVSEAYSILSDTEKKNDYDFSVGNRFNHHKGAGHRRKAPPPNYRKVYVSQEPPASWKGRTWNHELHYYMHYGTGMRDEAIRQAKESARKQGAFEYHSPLGRGFSFSSSNDPRDNINPYSKHSVQGPRTMVFEYEEGYQDAGNKSSDGGKQFVQRREKIVEDLHGRREERHLYEEEQRRQRQRSNAAPFFRTTTQGILNGNFNNNNSWSYSTGTATATTTAVNDCVIL
jgi:curved DNA-binding protein CbpA